MYVTNNNDFDYTDRFNGNDYVFPAGGTVAVDIDAARHFFGLGDVDKMPYLIRTGWANSSNGLAEGMKILGNFVFGEEPKTMESALQTSDATSEETATDTSTPLEVVGAPAPSDAPIQEVVEKPAKASNNLLDKLASL